MQDILFVSGVGRSGTSALVNVLNAHPNMLIGQERFFWKFRKETIDKSHFDKERFLDVRRPEDTHEHAGLKLTGGDPRARFDNARYIGDKFPSLFRHFDVIFERFPAARHLYIVRNPLSVVESYDVRHQNPDDSWTLTWKDGMDAWNESVGKVARLPEERLKQFTLLQYENFYKSPANINRMFASMGLDALPEDKLRPFVAKFESLNDRLVPRRDDLRTHIARNADWASYEKLLSIMES